MLWKSAAAVVVTVMALGLRVAIAEEESTATCIVLEGTPEEVGARFAKLNGAKIKADFERFTRENKDLLTTGKTYHEITKKLAPHWLAEAAAVAKGECGDSHLFLASFWPWGFHKQATVPYSPLFPGDCPPFPPNVGRRIKT